MKASTAFLLSLAVLGAFAKPQSNNFRSNSFNGAYGSSLPVTNTHIQTPVVENPTVVFPSYIPPTSISESCHYLNTLVRPQIHNEIITVPTVDRIVRTVPSSVVETINTDGGTRVTTISNIGNLLSSAAGGRGVSEGGNNNSGGGNNEHFRTNQNSGEPSITERRIFFAVQTPARNSNSFTSVGRSNTFVIHS